MSRTTSRAQVRGGQTTRARAAANRREVAAPRCPVPSIFPRPIPFSATGRMPGTACGGVSRRQPPGCRI